MSRHLSNSQVKVEIYRRVCEIRGLIEASNLQEELDETYGSVVSIESHIPREIMDLIFPADGKGKGKR